MASPATGLETGAAAQPKRDLSQGADRHGTQRPPLPGPLSAPRVSDNPILWKELHIERGLSMSPVLRSVLAVVISVGLTVAYVVLCGGIAISLAHGEALKFANVWVQIVGTTLACLMLLQVAVHAARSLALERDRRTLDNVLTTLLDDRTIVYGKILGSMLSVNRMWGLLGMVWGVGLLTGGLHLVSVVLLVAAWWVLAGFVATLGVWFSLRCRSPLQATLATLLVLLIFGTGQPFVWLLGAPFSWMLYTHLGLGVPDYVLYVLTVPGSFVSLAFSFGTWYTFDPALGSSWVELILAMMGLGGYALAAVGLRAWLLARFRLLRSGPQPRKD